LIMLGELAVNRALDNLQLPVKQTSGSAAD